MATRALAANEDVFLIDHAYSFAVESYRRDLEGHPELRARLAAMMGLREPEEGAGAEEEEDDVDEEEDEEAWPMARPDGRKPLYDQLCEQVWRYAGHYRLADPRNPLANFRTVWYVMDEFGSAFQHAAAAAANFRVAAFVYLPQGKLAGAVAFSLAWPVRAVAEGDECRRDFAPGLEAGSLQRAARLATWFRLPAAVRRRMGEAHAAKFEELARIERVRCLCRCGPGWWWSLGVLVGRGDLWHRILSHVHPRRRPRQPPPSRHHPRSTRTSAARSEPWADPSKSTPTTRR